MLVICMAFAVLFLVIDPVSASGRWPEGLGEAVNSHFQALQVTEYLIRDSTLEDPRGIQPMTSFDRASHKCHEVPGQVYRVYKVPTSYTEDKDGAFIFRSRFELFYRQADSITGIFSSSWKQGSDGAIQVRFDRVDGKWEAVETREILDAGDSTR